MELTNKQESIFEVFIFSVFLVQGTTRLEVDGFNVSSLNLIKTLPENVD